MSTAEERVKTGRLSWGVRLAFGSGDFYGGASAAIIGMCFLYFLNKVAGIEIGTASLIILVGRVVDAVTDPLMGAISDRTRSRWGRRVTWFAAGIVPVTLSYCLLWMVPEGLAYTSRLIYYFVTYSFFSIAFTMVMVPYGSLPQELTSADKERSLLVAVRMSFSVIGSLIAGVLPMLIVNSFGVRDAAGSITFNPGMEARGYFNMGIIFAALFGLLWLMIFLVLRGKENEPGGTRQTVGFFSSLKLCLGNPAFLVLCGIYLLSFTPVDIMSANFVFFLKYSLGKYNLFALSMGTLMLCVALSFPLYLKFVGRFGRRMTFIGGSAFRILVLPLLFIFSPASSTGFLVLVCILMGLGTGVAYAIPWAMLTEITDLDEASTGLRQEGIYTGVMTFIRKLASGGGIAMVGLLLKSVGFEGNESSAASQSMLLFILTLLPMALLSVGIIFGFLYPMSESRVRFIQSVVALRRNGRFAGLQNDDREKILHQVNTVKKLKRHYSPEVYRMVEEEMKTAGG